MSDRSDPEPPRHHGSRDKTRVPSPSVVASWTANAASVTADAQLIGGKAVGLFRLPQAWVPPFVVLMTRFAELFQAVQSVRGALTQIPADQLSLLDHFLKSVLPVS